MRIAVLGPLEVDEGRTVLSPRDQVALEALAALPGEALRAEALAEAIWGEQTPVSWPKVVQGCVVRLRKALGPSAVTTTSAGYRLTLHRDDFDHLRFEDLLVRAREQLASGEAERARYTSDQALALWRGEPFDHLGEWAPGRVESERLGERHRDAEDLHAEATIRAGHSEDVLGSLHRMVAQSPARERRWGLLALAQYQLGRQADALGTIQRCRSMLVTELGLDPGPELLELERSILQQDPSLVAESAPDLPMATSPYLGLLAYDVGDSAAYFGREKDLAACLRRIGDTGLLAVVGPSGCGKSSLVRAGVAAALERDGNRVVVVTPGKDLADALAQAPRGRNAVLVVDQCEEALALPESSPERVDFFAGLVDFAGRGQLVLSLRADRLGELSAHPVFAHLVVGGLYLLGAMSEDELRAAIEGPGRQAGLRLEPGLVDLLVTEVRGQPAALPLLSHVLRQTWRRREGNTLTVAAYAATGGVRRAVAQSAEQLYGEMTTAQQALVRELMVRLVSPDELGEPVPARVPRQSLSSDEEHAVVVERLVGARLLTTDGDTVEIAHESLARAWPRLRSWLDDDVEGLRIMRHLAVAAASWDALGRPDSELYRGARQAKTAEWHTRAKASLTDSERDFLQASAALAEKQERDAQAQVRRERRLNQRLRAGLAAVAVLLAVAIVAGSIALTTARSADQQALAADARRLGAEALRDPNIDRAVLLGIAGVLLDDAVDTRNTLSQVLDRTQALVGAVRTTPLVSLSVRPDGRTVATGGALRGVTIFDAQSLREVARNDDVPVAGVAFSPDGSLLAAAVNPWTPTGERRVDEVPLRLLDGATARPVPVQLEGAPEGWVLHQSFGFSADGSRLAAGFIHPREEVQETRVRVWDLSAPRRPVASYTLAGVAQLLRLSADARVLYTTSDEGIRAHDAGSGRQLAARRMEPAPGGMIGPVGLGMNPDSSRLVGRDGSQIRVMDSRRLTPTSSFSETGHIGRPIAVASDGQHVAYVLDGTVVVRDLDEPTRNLERYGSGSDAEPWGLAFGQDGATLYAARSDGLLLAWDRKGSRRQVAVLSPPAESLIADHIWSRVSPDGHASAFLRGNPTSATGPTWVQFQDLRSGGATRAVEAEHRLGYFAEVAWSPDSEVAATVTDDEWVRLWDRDTGRLAEEYRVAGDGATTVAFTNGGDAVAIGTRNGRLHVFGKAVGKWPPVLISHSLPVALVAASDDGTRAVAVADNELVLVDLSRGVVARRFKPGVVINAVALSPDGSRLAVSGIDHAAGGADTVLEFDTETLAQRSKSEGGNTASGYHLSYSPDGTRLLTHSGSRMGLWDAATHGLLMSVATSESSSAAFTADGRSVVISGSDGAIARWHTDSKAITVAACRIVGRDLTKEEWNKYLPERDQEPVCPR